MVNTSPYRCQDIAKLRDEKWDSPIPLIEVQKSASSGCLLCQIILAAVEPHAQPRRDGNTVEIHRSTSRFEIRVDWQVPEPDSQYHLEVFCLEDARADSMPVSRILCDSTESENAIGRIIEWCLKCLNTHRMLCNSMSNGSDTLPHRVLDLGAEPSLEIKLLETNGLSGRYACLSHSWGGHQPLRTTIDTLSDHKEHIPWEKLPKTFQDTISVTRRLNLQYLWIDSLCIIQDSDDDWLTESALMADIYRNAAITVSAAASTGPYDGLFVETKPAHRGTKLVHPLLKTDGATPDVYSRSPLNHDRLRQPLLDRGWVMQERLLSPRVIHFGRYELIWECMEKHDCECGRGFHRGEWFSEKANFHPGAFLTLPLYHTAYSWRKIVQDFCGLTLTKERDAFPAVAGAAKIIKQSLVERGMEAKYVAGMWDIWFAEDCLWSVAMVEYAPPRLVVWRAPTFSWASVVRDGHCHVKYRHAEIFHRPEKALETPRGVTVLASLEDFNCEPIGTDEMGPIKSGYAVLRGTLLRAILDRNELLVKGQKVFEYPIFAPDYNLSMDGPYRVEHGSTLWCLQLVSLRSPLAAPAFEYLWCMVLRQVEETTEGQLVCERVGLMWYRESLGKPVEEWFDSEHVLKDAVIRIV